MTERESTKLKLVNIRATLESLINQLEILFDDAYDLNPEHTKPPCTSCIQLRHQLEALQYKPTATEESLLAELTLKEVIPLIANPEIPEQQPPGPLAPKKTPKKKTKPLISD
jgi:hypothetical protein